MNGERNLAVLLQQMDPELNTGEYVFCTIPYEVNSATGNVLFSFKEKEGLTVVVSRKDADTAGLHYSLVCSWITLRVHSSLEAVGLTAAFSTALAKAGISCNVVAAYYHDHIFVPVKDATKAMEVLKSCSSRGQNDLKHIST